MSAAGGVISNTGGQLSAAFGRPLSVAGGGQSTAGSSKLSTSSGSLLSATGGRPLSAAGGGLSTACSGKLSASSGSLLSAAGGRPLSAAGGGLKSTSHHVITKIWRRVSADWRRLVSTPGGNVSASRGRVPASI